MADNKATALKSANNKLKIYYEGVEPGEVHTTELQVEALDDKNIPWLFKFYTRNGVCLQFADTMTVYRRISVELSEILDAVIVNTKQRSAIDRIISKALLDYLAKDIAGEKDVIEDPVEL